MSGEQRRDTQRGPLFLYGFLAIFVIVGCGCLLYAPVKIVRTLTFIKTAASATGTVDGMQASRGSKSTTYTPVVSFHTLDGRTIRFRSQVSGSSSAYYTGEEVPVLYDPQQPELAEINKFTPLWMPVVILLGLGVSFTAAGGGMILATRHGVRQARQREAALRQGVKEWESDLASRSGVVACTTRKEMWFYWLFSSAWNAIALPTGFISIDELIHHGNKPAALGLLFPIVGGWLLTVAILKTMQNRKFRDLTLRMDPWPGSIGGEVGGVIELRLPFSAAQIFNVSLSCQHLVRRHKGTDEVLIWQDNGRAAAAPGRAGTSIAFRFAVPAHLPPTSSEPDKAHNWVVRVTAELPGIDLDSTFVVPVATTSPPTVSTLSAPLAPAAAPVETIPASSVRIERSGGDLVLFYSPRRNVKWGIGVCIAGAWFVLIPALMISKSGGVALLLLPFLMIGLFLFLYGVWLLGNSLEVTAGAGRLRMLRCFLGFPVSSRDLVAGSVNKFEAVRFGALGTGSKARLIFTVVARLRDGNVVTVGDGIDGRANAEAIADALAGSIAVSQQASGSQLAAGSRD